MADPKINIIVEAVDHASGVLGGLNKAIGGLGKVALGIGVAGVAALGAGIVAAAATIPDMIGKASDLNETISKTKVIFGDVSADMIATSTKMATTMGLSQQAWLDANATFGVFGKQAGLVGEDLYNFSGDLTSLAADLASFSNTTPEEAILALGAGLRGESEPLRRYGILLDDATLRQKALELGIISDIKNALTPQQRVLAANAVIMQQTADAAGDFERTSGGLANQQRILAAQITNVKTTLGKALIPVVNTFINMITEFVSSEKFTAFMDQAVVVLQNLAVWLGANLPIALQYLSDLWTGTLQPAIAAVWNFLSTVVIPFIQGVLIPWLQVNIPIALQFLSDVWTTVLQPAIAAVWQFMSTILIPFLQSTVIPFLQVAIPAAIQFLSDAWTKVLRPAIEAVWKFLSVDMMPVWEALGELLGVVIPMAITIIKSRWENVLLPALKTVWEFLNTYVVPIFKALWESFSGISNAISIVVGWIKILTDKLKNLELPEWLVPGSPTPFEMGLRGISDAMKELHSVSLSANFVPGGISGGNGTTNNFSMSVHTNAQSSTVMRDFNMMRSMAG